MNVDLRSPKEIIVHDFRLMTLKQFVNSNVGSKIFSWIDGYLISFVHMEKELFDAAIRKGVWEYAVVEVAPMPKFEETIQARHHKISIFDLDGISIMQAIADEVKKKNG